MAQPRQLHLGAFMRPVSIHTGAWRYPGADPRRQLQLSRASSASPRRSRRRKFDAFFMADHLGVLNMPVESLQRSHTVTSFEPFTLLGALAAATERIGLVATASTTFDEPFHVARRFASLDHISGGRAGWNVVTTANPDDAKNFGYEEQPDHAARYARAREFYDVVTGLWDSFADDAFVRDADSGIYLRSRQAPCARPQGQAFFGARPAQHRAARPGLAGHRTGRGIRARPPARRRDRRGRVCGGSQRARAARLSTPT